MRASFPSPTRSSPRSASCSASRRRSRRSSCPTSTSRSTRRLRRPASGTRSRPSVLGGRSYLRTSAARRPDAPPRRLRRARGARGRLLRHPPVVVRPPAVVGPDLALRAADPGGVRARLARAAALAVVVAGAARAGDRVRGRRGRATGDGRGRGRELRQARRDDVRCLVLPALLRGAELGRAGGGDRAVRGLLLGLARPDEHDREREAGGVLGAVVHVPGAGGARRCDARIAGSALLRAVPGRDRPLAAADCVDVAVPGRGPRRDDGARDVAGRRRPPRAAAALGRVPAPERRPSLAGGTARQSTARVSRTPAGLSLDPHTAAYVRDLAERLRMALGNKLAGVYLHGSAVLGDFVRARSDLDLVAVSEGPLG